MGGLLSLAVALPVDVERVAVNTDGELPPTFGRAGVAIMTAGAARRSIADAVAAVVAVVPARRVAIRYEATACADTVAGCATCSPCCARGTECRNSARRWRCMID